VNAAVPMKANAWLPEGPVLASMVARSIRSPEAPPMPSKSTIASRVEPPGLESAIAS
jgi:hypothetical protein